MVPITHAMSHRASRRARMTALVISLLVLSLFVAVRTAAPARAATALLSQGKPTTASSVESAAYGARNATDGSATTRWSSAFSDTQWLQVDLGSSLAVGSATLSWEAA